MTSIPNEGLSVPQSEAPQPGATKRSSGALDGFWEVVDFLKAYLSTDTGRLIALLIVSMAFTFSAIIRHLPETWFDSNSYFTHGVLVPFLCIYILYDRREAIAAAPVKPLWGFAIPLLGILYCVYVASRAEMTGPLSYGCIAAAFLTALTIGGWKMTKALSPALFFLIFALPFGKGFLDQITVKFQGLSTDMAYEMLKLFHVGPPIRINSTQIIIGDYSLYVAAACSGLKLTLSVIAFVVLFMIIGRLKWWANAILIASILPLCILVNGLRIAMIGAVGCYAGEHNAEMFHDWSGYLSIVVCFLLLMKLTRTLGWK